MPRLTRPKLLLWLVVIPAGLAACAATRQGPPDDIADGYARRGPPRCTRQDLGAIEATVQTCVQDFGPSSLPDEMRMRHPYVVTVIDTPEGSVSNPLMWSVAVERDGEVVVDRTFGAHDTAFQTQPTGQGRLEIQSAIPMDDQGELQPGTYEVQYQSADGKDMGTATITVDPPEGQTSPP